MMRSVVAEFLAIAPTIRAHHLRDWLRFHRHTSTLREGMPWLSWPCIDWMATYVKPGMRVLEYGGGGSSLWFLKRGCSLVTVEESEHWVEEIRRHVAMLSHADHELRHIPRERRAEYASQAATGGPWDLILVDGAWRQDCVLVAKDHVKPGGVIVIDNLYDPGYASAAEILAHGFTRQTFAGLGCIRRRPTETDVFRHVGRGFAATPSTTSPGR